MNDCDFDKHEHSISKRTSYQEDKRARTGRQWETGSTRPQGVGPRATRRSFACKAQESAACAARTTVAKHREQKYKHAIETNNSAPRSNPSLFCVGEIDEREVLFEIDARKAPEAAKEPLQVGVADLTAQKQTNNNAERCQKRSAIAPASSRMQIANAKPRSMRRLRCSRCKVCRWQWRKRVGCVRCRS